MARKAQGGKVEGVGSTAVQEGFGFDIAEPGPAPAPLPSPEPFKASTATKNSSPRPLPMAPSMAAVPAMEAPQPFTGTEILIQTTLDEEKRTWSVQVLSLAHGGELLGDAQDAGEVVLDEEERPVTRNGLLGLALDRGIQLAEGLETEGEVRIVAEVSTWQNGVLRVSLYDWLRAGLGSGGATINYATEAWLRIAQALQRTPPDARLQLRWRCS